VRNVVTTMRNLYWVREMEAPGDSRELKLLRSARFDAQGLVEIMQSREIGVPSFVIAGLLIPLAASIWRVADGFRFDRWWVALLVGLAWVAIGLGLSWVILRGTAMASRRIRLAAREPLEALWDSVGNCGRPPRDQSRSFAYVAITLAVGVWIVLPMLVAIALAAGARSGQLAAQLDEERFERERRVDVELLRAAPGLATESGGPLRSLA